MPLWTLLLACAPAPDAQGTAPIGTALRFDAQADLTQDFFALPYPLDSRRTPDGHPDVANHPRPEGHLPSAQLLTVIGDATGFSTTPTVVFQLNGPPAAADPSDGPSEHAWFVDLETGDTLPALLLSPEPDPYTPEHALTLGPVPGDVLTPGHRWAALVTRGHGDADGAPLGQAPALAEALAGRGPLGALLGDVAARVDDPTQLAAATVFTPGDEVDRTARFSDAVREAWAPELADLAVVAVHDRMCELTATLTLPQFQSGTPPFDQQGGLFFTDGEAPPATRQDVAPVVITLPRADLGAGPAPLVFWAHGSGGRARDVVDRGPVTEPDGEPTPGRGPAWVLARHGLATASVTVLLSEERLGFARGRPYLNLTNVGAYRDTWRQALSDARLTLDALARLRLPAELLAACPDLHVDGPDLGLAPRFAMGQSAGAHLVTELAAIDPRVQALVPTGSGGHWSLLLSGGSEAGGPPELIGLALGTPARLSTLHPGLALLQHAFEAAEPLVYARRLRVAPLPGRAPVHVYVPFGQGDGYFPEPTFDAMAVAYGASLAGAPHWPSLAARLSAAGVGAVTLPATRNADGVTAVITTWPDDGLTDPHNAFQQWPGLQHQYGCFFRTMVDDGAPTVPVPGDEDAPCAP